MHLRIGPLFGWGVVLYAIMYLLAAALSTYGLTEGMLPRVVSMLMLVISAIAAGHTLRASTWRDILPYSISWAIIVALIDGALTFPYGGLQVYGNPNVWFGYLLVALSPLLSLYPRFSKVSAATSV